MSTINPPVVTSKVTAEAVRNADRKLRLASLIDEALVGDYDAMDIVFNWNYDEPVEVRSLSDGERRQAALAWLARHVSGLQQISRHASACGWEPEKPLKFADGVSFGVKLWLRPVGGVEWSCIEATVPAALTCEMRPTGQVEVIPATEAREVPVMERVCPDSIFAGIQDEVTA